MNSWIYKITNKTTTEIVYIGSTTGKYFCIRKCDHMRPHTQTKLSHMPLYSYIKNNGGWINFEFGILHELENIDKIQLLTLEKEEIKFYNPICNINSPITTYEERLEQKRITAKKWRDNNPEIIMKYTENRNKTESYKKCVELRCKTKIECPCGGKYTLQNKTNHFSRNKHKKYEEKNIDKE